MIWAHLLVENLIFLAIATIFLAVTGWAWKTAKPYRLPQPLPEWFRVWFLSVQIFGIIPPLIALVWGIWQGYSGAIAIWAAYFAMLGAQILSEFLALRQFRSVVWVMVPYLYVPYRLWQLYEGLILINPEIAQWMHTLLIGEIVLWAGNYLLDLAQLPRLFRWETIPNSKADKSLQDNAVKPETQP
ncbi:MAG TPA: hypothetical protein ACFE0H_04030 [Elainellaceae cyanobacterium]